MNRNLPTFYEAEERNKLSHFTVQGFDLNGVVQGGANDGEEVENFIRMGVEHLVAFEPLSSAFEILEERYGDKVKCFQVGLHDETTRLPLHVTSGDGKGSSLFDGVWDHPEVMRNWTQGQAAIEGDEIIDLIRFDEFVEQHPEIDWTQYDTLQLDTQGNEMEILQGMGNTLQHFKYLCIELSITPVYRGETPGRQVADWLHARGFILDSPIFEHNDSFFVRGDIKATSNETYQGRC